MHLMEAGEFMQRAGTYKAAVRKVLVLEFGSYFG